MVLGGIASVLAAAWKFLAIGNPETIEGPLNSLYALARRIRTAGAESELSVIEEEIDSILKTQRIKAQSGRRKRRRCRHIECCGASARGPGA